MRNYQEFTNEEYNEQDYDEQDYEFAKWVFEQEEGRKPNMNNTKDMNVVAILQVGIRYARNRKL